MAQVVDGTETGKYAPTVKKIANGETGNQTTFNAPITHLENRTTALRTAVNDNYITMEKLIGAGDVVGGLQSTFNTSHNHNGTNGAKIGLEEAYLNGGTINKIGLTQGGAINIKSSASLNNPCSFSFFEQSTNNTTGVKVFSVTDTSTEGLVEVNLHSGTSTFKINDSSNNEVLKVDNLGNLTTKAIKTMQGAVEVHSVTNAGVLTAKSLVANDGTTEVLKADTNNVTFKKPVKLLNSTTEVFSIDIDGKTTTQELKVMSGADQKFKAEATGVTLNAVELKVVDAASVSLFSVSATGDLVANSLEAKSGSTEIIKADVTNGVVLKKGLAINDGTANTVTASTAGALTAKSLSAHDGTVDVLNASTSGIVLQKELKTMSGATEVFKVSTTGSVESKELNVNNNFKVSSDGTITATQIKLAAGGSFQILDVDDKVLFKVDNDLENVTINNRQDSTTTP